VHLKDGKLSSNSIAVLERRYLIRDDKENVTESPEEMFRRVAAAIASQEKMYGATSKEIKELADKFFRIMWDLDFLPNSPTLMNAGTGQGTLSACYVLDISDTMNAIMDTAKEQALIEKFGGGVGFSLSGIRPKGSSISTTQGAACGPVAVLHHLSSTGKLVTQGGKRDGAHMAIMSVYHPDIEEFISCKTKEGDIHNFNISCGADSNFQKAVETDGYLHLTWPLDKKIYSKPGDDGTYVRAEALFAKIVDGAHSNGEPGLIWLDRINQDNTTPQLGTINATNPCGEQPLLNGESCNLGSINLGNFYVEDQESGGFNFTKFVDTVKLCVQFLDNVVDANTHPTDKTSHMNQQTRKIGLGVMGWADLLVKLRIPYDSEAALELASLIGKHLQEAADAHSYHLGLTKGDFPAFGGSTLNKNNGGTWEHMRNAWRLSIAPTGTISMIAGASSGIEPLFALSYKKHNMSSRLEGVELFYVNNDLKHELVAKNIVDDLDAFLINGGDLSYLVGKLDKETRRVFVASDGISPPNHVKMQAVWQEYVDSGISKTINLPSSATVSDVWDAYTLAWELKCKGITVYRQGSREKEVLVSTISSDSSVDVATELSPTKSRPRTLIGSTTKMRTGLGNLYVTVNKDANDEIYEVFATTGKAGGNEAASTEAICRLISVAMQYGVPREEIISQLIGIQSVPVWDNGVQVLSTADGIAKVLTEVGGASSQQSATRPNLDTTIERFSAVVDEQQSLKCPECSSALYVAEGCSSCVSCGYSRCG